MILLFPMGCKRMKRTILRRDLLKLTGMAAALAALASCRPLQLPSLAHAATLPTSTQIPQPTSLAGVVSPSPLISSTLRRILFAPTSDDLLRAAQIGLDPFIEEQLAPASISDPDVDNQLGQYDTLSMSTSDLLNVLPKEKVVQQLMEATLFRAVYSRRQLNELMVDFWSNHFNIYIEKSSDRMLKTADDRDVIRPNALGKFSDLLSASAHSPAMLIFLDNALSRNTNPNENYGRELLELHTLSVNGGYTQTDVHDAARALTGWTIYGPNTAQPGNFFFNPKFHDDGEKTILGQNFPAGQGIKDGEQLLSMLSAHPSTAGFISTKLVRRFVSDNPPASLVAKATDAFTKTGGDIAKVMSTILHSDEFKASLGQKIKRPFEYVVSALRVLGADIKPDLYTVFVLRQFGQEPFYWQSPNGYPDSADAWVTTSGVLTRWNYALALSFNAIKDTQVNLSNLVPAPTSLANGIDALGLRLLGEPMPGPERQILLDFAGNGDFGSLLPALTALTLSTIGFQYR
jgi:uncharacterized protein (DUF1800 family)